MATPHDVPCSRSLPHAVIASAPDLREQLLGLLRPGSSRLVIDMSKVSFCDARGLAVLVGTGRRARVLGGFLRLAAVSPQADRILRITGLHWHLPIFPTVSAATSPPGTPPSGAGTAAVSAHPARSWSGPASKPAGQARVMGNSRELRNAVTAVLTHAQAWDDAGPDRRFTPVLHALARACEGIDDVALLTTARSLLSNARCPSMWRPRSSMPWS